SVLSSRRRHTSCSRDWSSDVCSSDLKANPGLGTIKKIDELARKVKKAQENPLLVKNLLTKDFNVRETTTQAWLTFEQIDNQETRSEERRVGKECRSRWRSENGKEEQT